MELSSYLVESEEHLVSVAEVVEAPDLRVGLRALQAWDPHLVVLCK